MPTAMPAETERPVSELAALRIRRDREPKRRPTAWLIAGAVLAVLAGAGAYLGLKSYLDTVSVEKTTAAVITEGQAMSVLTASGYVEAETRADLSPKITSRITHLRVTEGSRVRKGDIIARLDHMDLDAQLAEAQAAQVNAEIDLKRQQALFGERLVPHSVLDSAVALEASTRARVDYIKALLSYTVLRAPFDGVVIAKRAHVGEAVSPFGSPGQGSSNNGAIVTLVDFSTLYVGADVNEANLARLSDQQPAEIVLDAAPGRVYHGYLRQVVPSADRQKGTVKVKVAIQDPDERILPDLSARVSFTSQPTLGREVRRLIQVPRSAIVTREGATGVYLIDNGRAVFRVVATGQESENGVEITRGLAGGEALVADASKLRLADGAKLKVTE